MIGIITPGNKKYTPYIQNYISILQELNEDYKIMSWDKNDLSEEDIDMRFDFPADDSNRKLMFWGYIRFIRMCKKFIKDNNIDKIIILTVAPAYFLGIRFLKHYKDRFIIDIRDDSPFVRRFPNHFKKICSLAKNVVVSSTEFSPWTGRDTILCHNADLSQLKKHREDIITERFNTPIRIAFAGVMIEERCNIDILNSFKGDLRFEHYYIGRENDGKRMIAEYVKTSRMDNVKFEGAYNKDEIVDIYRNKADLINVFRAKTTVNRNALPNKLYDAVLSGKPIVVFEHNVAIAKYAKRFSLGIVIPDAIQCKINEYLYSQVKNFDYERYKNGRTEFLNEVESDMLCFKKTITDFSVS